MSFMPLNQIAGFATFRHTDLNCSICTENFQEQEVAFAHGNDPTHADAAPHAVHMVCLRYWMNTGVTCPECRLTITHINGETLEEIRQAEEALAAERALQADVLNLAAYSGNLARVGELLQGDFTPEEIGKAVCCALNNEGLNSIPMLLARGISENKRGLAVVMAAEFGYANTVEDLLADGEITQVHRELALDKAAEKGHLNIALVLLASGEISEIWRESARDIAIANGHLAIAEALDVNAPAQQN